VSNLTFEIPQKAVADKFGFELLWLAIGTVFTGGLFYGMAHIEHSSETATPTVIEDLRILAAPFEPPPPPPQIAEQAAAVAEAPFAGLEFSRNESPVKIAVAPPAFDSLMPAASAPVARVQFAQLYIDLKPKMDLEADFKKVYQESEVDRAPKAITRVPPNIPYFVRKGAATMRVSLIMVIDTQGTVESVRVAQTSGNSEFDAIVAKNVKDEWKFSPAIRRSKKVKCMAQQWVRINWAGSPFEAQ
jgi:TonB family protein